MQLNLSIAITYYSIHTDNNFDVFFFMEKWLWNEWFSFSQFWGVLQSFNKTVYVTLNTHKNQYLTPNALFFFNFPCCGLHHLCSDGRCMRWVWKWQNRHKHSFMPLNSSDNHGSVHMFSPSVKTKNLQFHLLFVSIVNYSESVKEESTFYHSFSSI